MILDQAIEKQSYKVISIVDGKKIRIKLTSMGIYPDVVVKVVKNDHFGPIIIAINTFRISIGRELAKKIKVIEE